MKGKKPLGRRLTAAVFFFWMVSLLPAEAPPAGAIPAAVWDASASLEAPSWFGPVQTNTTSNMTIWRAPIRPPPGQSRLAVTLLLDETQGGFARLIWQGPARSVAVCGNLYEGAAPLHLRTLLLDRETLAGPGQLLLEATGNRPALVRAELSWVEPLVLAASGWTPPGLYLAASGKIFPADELQGQGRRAPSDERKGSVIDAVLDPGPVKIRPETPIRFLAPISATPAHGRLEAQVAGLGPGEEPVLCVNGRSLPAVAVEVPGLDDAGYRWMAGFPQISYGGWRTVTAYVPAGWLVPGENQVDWHCPAGSSGVTVRHLRLQLSYDRLDTPASPLPAASPAPVAAQRVTASAPAWPVSRPAAPALRLGLSSGSVGVGLRPE